MPVDGAPFAHALLPDPLNLAPILSTSESTGAPALAWVELDRAKELAERSNLGAAGSGLGGAAWTTCLVF